MGLPNLVGASIAGSSVPKDHAVAVPGVHARVLYLTDLAPSDKFGSMEEQIFELARAFRDRGGLFLPVFGGTPAPQVIEHYAQAGLAVEGMSLHEYSVASVFRLLALIRDNEITTVHWNFYSPINLYVWALSLLAPSVVHVRTDHTSRTVPLAPAPHRAKRLVKHVLFKRYKKVLCVSDFVVQCLEHQGSWSNVSRCTYFINTDRFTPSADVRQQLRKRFGAEEKFVLLLVAQLIRQKGGDVAIKSLTELPENVELWIVGDGGDRERLVRLCDELDLTPRVRFFGNQRNVEPYMQAADVFVCPSLWGEATGLVNLEALSSGLPVVASSIGGIPEFIADERNGLLFPPGDHRALATQIQRLLLEPALLTELSLRARSDALEQFSIERRIPEYVDVYNF
jgi:glycosyltransferase involved in cell wall biosynthesis